MKKVLNQKSRVVITVVATILVWTHLAWDYLHGGIPTHYLLHDKDLPGIPNWWGGIVLPIFTYFLLHRIHKRTNPQHTKKSLGKLVVRFLAGLLFAVIISVCFSYGIEVTDYIMGSLFMLAFVFPLYRSEYLLGWVFGAAFTFGAIIPIGFGSLLCLLFYIFYKMTRLVIGFFKPKNL
ncbi:hypothetical protein KIM67_18205 [Flagellimonas sp. 389]|uniref:hypothetical protein n=1 Tax=Flagellimonas sp. 389 TaxID=2835862 RepID=UPI001BD3DBD6|nr:hypothetical protein [Flagellimonas sp. 389]MBS9464360.1 hypothetical protein [Flagellimonas sp. 389]